MRDKKPIEGAGSFRFNGGSVLVLGAACCWGLVIMIAATVLME